MEQQRTSRREVDMTQGNITQHLVRFALPLVAGNLFQQLYNMVDTWVVGNYVSNEAFSAVGSVGPIVNMLIGFFMGLSSGAGVVISQFFGAKRFDKVNEAVHTAVVMTLVIGALFTALGLFMIPYMLNMMKTPAEVLPESTAYLRIYFSGMLGLMLYNIGSGIMRAVGDSRRPFYFLVVSALLNTGLDLLFVLKFHMGVRGVAWATIIAQAVSGILVMAVLMRETSCVRVAFKRLRVNWMLLRKIVSVGIPAALQMAVTAFSNVFVQSYINFFGADCMSGWTAYAKLDQLLFLPIQSLEISTMTFVGQNLGVGDTGRVRIGVRRSIMLVLGTVGTLMIPLLVFAPALVAFFNSKPEVVTYGVTFVRWMCPFFLIAGVMHILAGALKGSGNTRVPMIIMLSSFVLFRQCYLYVMAHFISNTIIPIAMAYPAGWCLCVAITVTYYLRTPLDRHCVVERSDKP